MLSTYFEITLITYKIKKITLLNQPLFIITQKNIYFKNVFTYI